MHYFIKERLPCLDLEALKSFSELLCFQSLVF